MIELKNYQRKAVDELKRKLIDMLNQKEDRQKLIFKAPTGAGKTVMASAVMDELTRDLSDSDECLFTRVSWVWIAPNKLHQQSYQSMRSFFSETRSLRPVMFDECDHLEGLQTGDVLFLNWESVNKDNAVLIRENEQNRTLIELIRNSKKNAPLVVVIDEEHMFGSRNAVKSERLLKSINPKIEFRISATPITQSYQAVEIRRSEVIDEQMIKKGIQLNPNIKSSQEQSTLTVNQRLLKKALEKREQLAELYKEYGVNPLLLIQLPNDNSATMGVEDKTIAEEMRSYLQGMCNISVDNGKLAVWLSAEKTPNLEQITRNNDTTEVLLFKQAIALGWDCPRAAVLLIFRELKSMQFTTQTVGRILRMPQHKFYRNDKLNYGYVYTNLSSEIIQIVGDDMNYISSVYSNKRPDIHEITLKSVYQEKKRPNRNRLGAAFRTIFRQTIEQEWEQREFSLFSEEDFFEDESPKDNIVSDTTELTDIIKQNRLKAYNHGIRTDVENVTIEIPKGEGITDDSNFMRAKKMVKMSLNASELDEMFNRFCYKNVGSFAKHDSTPVLRGAIESALEHYLSLNIVEIPKVVLCKQNKHHFEALIKKAVDKFATTITQKDSVEYGNFKELIWELPATRIYNAEQFVSKDGEIFNHALRPFFEKKGVSGPEYNFARWIDSNTEYVDWWYKNGDEGSEHFAVKYQGQDKSWHCFYVDFIIRLKDGTICLFDTKSKGSDENGVEKNNALYDYVSQYNKNGVKMIGGVLIQQDGNWYYPDGQIEHMDSTEGWKRLEFLT